MMERTLLLGVYWPSLVNQTYNDLAVHIFGSWGHVGNYSGDVNPPQYARKTSHPLTRMVGS